MGNKQSQPQEIQKRITDLERRIREKGHFGNNVQDREDVEKLLDYWHKKYGKKTKRNSLPTAAELIKDNFTCSGLLTKDKCHSELHSGCMWTPLIQGSNHNKYETGSADQINQHTYGGLCSKVKQMSELEKMPPDPSNIKYLHSQKRKTAPKRVYDLRMASIDPRNVGAKSKLRYRLSDKKRDMYVKESESLVHDTDQPESGTFTNNTDGEVKSGGRRSRKRRRKVNRRRKRTYRRRKRTYRRRKRTYRRKKK